MEALVAIVVVIDVFEPQNGILFGGSLHVIVTLTSLLGRPPGADPSNISLGGPRMAILCLLVFVFCFVALMMQVIQFNGVEGGELLGAGMGY